MRVEVGVCSYFDVVSGSVVATVGVTDGSSMYSDSLPLDLTVARSNKEAIAKNAESIMKLGESLVKKVATTSNVRLLKPLRAPENQGVSNITTFNVFIPIWGLNQGEK